jgi:hypothetical protein
MHFNPGSSCLGCQGILEPQLMDTIEPQLLRQGDAWAHLYRHHSDSLFLRFYAQFKGKYATLISSRAGGRMGSGACGSTTRSLAQTMTVWKRPLTIPPRARTIETSSLGGRFLASGGDEQQYVSGAQKLLR